MDNENVLTVSDLMINAIEENPVTFKDTFDALLMQKINDKLDAAKQEVAQNYFTAGEEEAPEEQQSQEMEDENGQDTETV